MSVDKKGMQLTLGFMQVGLDIVTSANCKSHLQFRQTNNYQILYITSSTYFQSAAARADGVLIPNLHKALSASVERPQTMNILQKILGTVFPPYKFSVLRQEQARLFTAIINSLPEDFNEIKQQTLSARLWGLDIWKLYPEFKFISLSYGGDTVFKYKKRGQSFKISGLQIFSNQNNKFEDIEILIQDNLVSGLKITNSQYQLNEFDLGRITNSNTVKAAFTFPPSDIDIFYDSLDQEIKNKLNPNDLFDIDFNNRTFYSFLDLEDGNYLAVDKNQKVYSLIHDAKPMATIMKISFSDILTDIADHRFDKEKHLDERYRNSK
jgi:hypothetical protein